MTKQWLSLSGIEVVIADPLFEDRYTGTSEVAEFSPRVEKKNLASAHGPANASQ